MVVVVQEFDMWPPVEEGAICSGTPAALNHRLDGGRGNTGCGEVQAARRGLLVNKQDRWLGGFNF